MSVTLAVILLGSFTIACLLVIVVMLVPKPGASASAVDVAASGNPMALESPPKNVGAFVRGPTGKQRIYTPAELRQQQTENRLLQAGLYQKGSTSRFLMIQVVMALAPMAVCFVCVQMHWITVFQAILFAAIPAIGGIIGPGFWLDHKKSGRQKLIRKALPDALDVIVVCLEAGLTMSAALIKVGKELRDAYPMLAAEITIVHREVQMGNATGEALLHFSQRFDLEELRSLSMVVRQAEKFGASLASALRVHAETLRVKRLQQAQERAQKATVKLLFPTVFCIFPALFVVILGPAAFEIMKTISK